LILRVPLCVSLERKALAQRYLSRREGPPVLALCAGRRTVRSTISISDQQRCRMRAVGHASIVERRTPRQEALTK